MREIKFRAWSPYWTPPFLTEDGKGVPAMEYFEMHELLGGYTPNADIGIQEVDVVVMQYTGLKDKNGKGIYEGDILRAKTGDFKCSVRFNQLLLQYLAIDDDAHVQISPCDWDEREVIGNIYENGDLLNVDN